jgi:hypothetical protein
MEVDGIEKELLNELTNRLVMNKEEVLKFFEGKVENSDAVAESVLKSLLEKGYATNVTLVSSSCYAVTTKGIKAVRLKELIIRK